MHAATRNSGLEAAGAIPWGTHFCQFYSSKDDLLETIVPYMKAGLEANEFCLWLTSPAVIDAREAEAALRREVPESGPLSCGAKDRIRPSSGQWYRDGGRFDANKALKSLLEYDRCGAEAAASTACAPRAPALLPGWSRRGWKSISVTKAIWTGLSAPGGCWCFAPILSANAGLARSSMPPPITSSR